MTYKPLGDGTAKMLAPNPSEKAKRGLLTVDFAEITFTGEAATAEEDAAIEYIGKLVEWWNIPYLQWNTGSNNETEQKQNPNRPDRRKSGSLGKQRKR